MTQIIEVVKKQKKWVAFILCLITLLACSCSKAKEKADSTDDTDSSTIASEVATPTPTPASTYTPGSELYGMLSVTGDVVIEPQYNCLDLFTEDGLARFQDYDTGLWGYVNESGEEVLPAQYEDAQNFSEGLAAVKVDGLYGFIDVTGEMVIEPQFEGVASEFAFERCVIQEDGKQGVIDQTGKVTIEAKYLSITLCCETYFVAQCEDKMYQVLDQSGSVMAEDEAEIYMVTDSGYYFVSGSDIDNRDRMYDFAGNQLYIYTERDATSFYSNDNSIIAASSDGETWGIYDLSIGLFVVSPSYDGIQYDAGETYAITYIGLDKMGLVDTGTGETVVDCVMSNIEVANGYVVYVDSNGNWGLMDLSGQEILPAEYQFIEVASMGFLSVVKDNANYLIDSDKNVVQEFTDKILTEYVPSIHAWLFQYTASEESEIDFIDGIMSDSYEVIVEKEYQFYVANGMGGDFPKPTDLSMAPVILDESTDSRESKYCFVDSEGYVGDNYYSAYSWFPGQGVLVVEDFDGNDGLVSYDGTVLFEPSKCHIFTNSNTGTIDYEDETDQYSVYNDTEYLIYTVDK